MLNSENSIDRTISEVQELYTKTITYYICFCIKREKKVFTLDDEYQIFKDVEEEETNNEIHK